jgi:putative oxidoreductase
MATFTQIRETASRNLDKAAWLGPLLARLSVGVMFAVSGWGKLHSLPNVTEFFTELGIPAPGFHARLVAVTEFAGGLALVAGLATQLAALPLAFTMVIALITAKRAELDGVLDLLAVSEFTYFCVLVWLAVSGAGAASADALILRRGGKPAVTRRDPAHPSA